MVNTPNVDLKPSITLCSWARNFIFKESLSTKGPVVQGPVSTYPRLNFSLDFFIPLLKSLFGTIFMCSFKGIKYSYSRQKYWLNFLLKLLDLKSDFTLTLGYLNPALKNPALVSKISLLATISQVKAGKGQPLRKLTLETWQYILKLGFGPMCLRYGFSNTHNFIHHKILNCRH